MQEFKLGYIINWVIHHKSGFGLAPPSKIQNLISLAWYDEYLSFKIDRKFLFSLTIHLKRQGNFFRNFVTTVEKFHFIIKSKSDHWSSIHIQLPCSLLYFWRKSSLNRCHHEWCEYTKSMRCWFACITFCSWLIHKHRLDLELDSM